jgi:hypothetical protein
MPDDVDGWLESAWEERTELADDVLYEDYDPYDNERDYYDDPGDYDDE